MTSDHRLPLSPAKLDDPDFDAAVTRFQQLLRVNNYSEKIVWVVREDVLVTGKRLIYVRVPSPATSEGKARRMYEEGVAGGRGLLMSTLCGMNAPTYCYIWFPKSAEEVPQGIWPHDGSVKLSAMAEASRVPGKPVESRLLWAFLKLRYRRKQHLKDFLFFQ